MSSNDNESSSNRNAASWKSSYGPSVRMISDEMRGPCLFERVEARPCTSSNTSVPTQQHAIFHEYDEVDTDGPPKNTEEEAATSNRDVIAASDGGHSGSSGHNSQLRAESVAFYPRRTGAHEVTSCFSHTNALSSHGAGQHDEFFPRAGIHRRGTSYRVMGHRGGALPYGRVFSALRTHRDGGQQDNVSELLPSDPDSPWKPPDWMWAPVSRWPKASADLRRAHFLLEQCQNRPSYVDLDYTPASTEEIACGVHTESAAGPMPNEHARIVHVFMSQLPFDMPLEKLQDIVDTALPRIECEGNARMASVTLYDMHRHLRRVANMRRYDGCAFAKVREADISALLSLHKRVLFDVKGYWIAETADALEGLQCYCGVLKGLSNDQRCHLFGRAVPFSAASFELKRWNAHAP